MATAFTQHDLQLGGVQARLPAKLAEFSGWAVSGDRAGQETCRAEASALLEAYFDISEEAVAETIQRGAP